MSTFIIIIIVVWFIVFVIGCSADETYGYTMGKLASVNYEGVVTWVPHGRLKSRCQLDLTRFPFDTQVCQLWFGPWSYDKALVDVRLADNANEYREFVQVC